MHLEMLNMQKERSYKCSYAPIYFKTNNYLA